MLRCILGWVLLMKTWDEFLGIPRHRKPMHTKPDKAACRLHDIEQEANARKRSLLEERKLKQWEKNDAAR